MGLQQPHQGMGGSQPSGQNPGHPHTSFCTWSLLLHHLRCQEPRETVAITGPSSLALTALTHLRPPHPPPRVDTQQVSRKELAFLGSQCSPTLPRPFVLPISSSSGLWLLCPQSYNTQALFRLPCMPPYHSLTMLHID